MNPKEPMTLETLTGYLKEHPGQEKELCQDYLAAWVRKRSVPPRIPTSSACAPWATSSRASSRSAGGIPLTRLRQNQNVAEFKTLLASLRGLSPEPLEATAIVQSFMAIHSGAEVYRAGGHRGHLRPGGKNEPRRTDAARSPACAPSSASNGRIPRPSRTPAPTAPSRKPRTKSPAAIAPRSNSSRRGLRPEDADWKQFIVRGQLFFDAAEYEFSRQIKLTDYVSLRDEAFASYRKAAEIYAAKIPELPRGQWTLEPYQMWFFVMLGASDLSQLTRAAARSDPGLKQIGDAMRALPGEAADGHLQKFGKMLGGPAFAGARQHAPALPQRRPAGRRARTIPAPKPRWTRSITTRNCSMKRSCA